MILDLAHTDSHLLGKTELLLLLLPYDFYDCVFLKAWVCLILCKPISSDLLSHMEEEDDAEKNKGL